VQNIKRNIINVVSNPALFEPSPTVELENVEYDGKSVVRIWVPSGETAYRYKGTFYDRVADADVRLKGAEQISLLYMRKQGRYSEQRVLPYVTRDDIRWDVVERARGMARLRNPQHPWASMDDDALMRSARLYRRDREAGVEGYTLAAVMLFGTDDVILDVCPAYRTDAVARFHDLDRYDDRLVVATNLLDSYSQLIEFVRRNAPDKFVLEGDARVSPRDVIARELVANCLVHREFTSPLPAKVVVGPDAIRTENASRCSFEGRIRLGDFNPIPKNPTIAHVFSNIGLAEELGSGLRNLEKYSVLYSGQEPLLEDGDVFRASVALPDAAAAETAPGGDAVPTRARRHTADVAQVIRDLLGTREAITAKDVAQAAGCSLRTAQRYLKDFLARGELAANERSGRMEYRQPAPGKARP
jgi:ATP-dependent DNA helicase RecG